MPNNKRKVPRLPKTMDEIDYMGFEMLDAMARGEDGYEASRIRGQDLVVNWKSITLESLPKEPEDAT